MAKFKIKKSGTSKDKSFWCLITKEVEGVVCRAFITTVKLQEEGKDLTIPDALEKNIDWAL